MVIGADREAYDLAFFVRGISDKQWEKIYVQGDCKIGSAGACWESERSLLRKTKQMRRCNLYKTNK
jgi:hypothetical protein